MDDRAKDAAAASPAQVVLQAAARNQDKVLADFLKAHPELTPEQAETMLRDEGH
jgi:hypothetical protein